MLEIFTYNRTRTSYLACPQQIYFGMWMLNVISRQRQFRATSLWPPLAQMRVLLVALRRLASLCDRACLAKCFCYVVLLTFCYCCTPWSARIQTSMMYVTTIVLSWLLLLPLEVILFFVSPEPRAALGEVLVLPSDFRHITFRTNIICISCCCFRCSFFGCLEFFL